MFYAAMDGYTLINIVISSRMDIPKPITNLELRTRKVHANHWGVHLDGFQMNIR
jgi:hypothetical protein